MVDPADRLTAALAERYRVERTVGSGGMATVYLALDLKHDRRVAIKVLRPALAEALGPERFLREIRVAAQLSHPHILPLHDSGEAGGILYYVMPFVDGESLRQRLNREGPLPIADALEIAGEVAGALHYAHERGIVHRDIKPENILLSGGHAVVVDFGIARPGTTEATRLTATGLLVGTPQYMSPEQMLGDRELDGRSDLYSLACLLYEMLTGSPPFAGPTLQGVIARQLGTPPPRASAFRAGVPVAVEEALIRALASEPQERHPSTLAFAAALRQRVDGPIPTRTTGEPSSGRTPFVGRQKERSELTTRLDQLARGVGGLVLIGGEPGVGKTRLAEWVLAEARSRRALALVGHCIEMEGASAPFQPFVEQLETVLRIVPPNRVRQTLGDAGPDLTRIFPRLKQVFPDLPPPLELPPEQQRQHLFRSYREFIERAAWNQPIVALFDDLHWADESSLLLLEHLAQQLHAVPLLAIGTYRDVELDVNRPFAKTLERLTRQRWATRVALRSLAEPEVAVLIGGMAGRPAPEMLVTAINRETDGNPFFCEEVFRHLAETGRLFDEAGGWRSNLDLAELEVPEGVRLVVSQRLERMTPACRALLTSAAVIGPRFELALLEALEDTGGDALLDALDQAERAKLIRSQGSGRAPVYAFAHELIRATLLGGLSLPRRQRKHLKVADALERLSRGRTESRVPELAYHTYQAGAAAEVNRTIGYQVAAANQALATGAFEEALRLAEQAVSLLEEPGTKQEAELTRLKGVALRSLGRYTQAIEALQDAFDSFEQLGETESVARLTIELATLLGYQVENDRVIAVAERGLAMMGDRITRERAMILIYLGGMRACIGDYVRGVEELDRGRREGIALGDQRVAQFARLWLGWVRHYYAEYVEDVAAEAAEPAGETWHDPFGEADLLGFRHQMRTYAGDFAAADRIEPLAERQAKRSGHRGAEYNLALGVAVRRWAASGDLEAFVGACRDVPERFPDIRYAVLFGRTFLASAEFFRGQWDEALDLIEDMARVFPEGGWVGIPRGMAILYATYAGRPPSQSLEALERDLPDGGPAILGRWIGMLHLVEVCALADRRATAAALYLMVLKLLERGFVLFLHGLTEAYAGIAAACAERWTDAERHFDSALRQAHELPYVVAQPETRRWYAWMLVDRNHPGDRTRARQLLEEAIAGYRKIGMPRHIELAERLLDSAGRGSG